MTTEVNDELAFLSQSFSVYNHFVPQQDAMEPAKANPRRRRQRKNKDGDDALKKRKLSENQVKLLEQSFGSDHKLETERKERLATEIGLHPRQVAVWFQNRRARWKKQRAEEEYFKLKAEHENTVVEKCILEAQVIKLRDQLAEAQKELWDIGLSSNSIGNSGLVEGVENNVFYMPDDSYVSGFEWDSLYLM